MPSPMPINLQDDIGVKSLGNAFFKYLELDKAISLLDNAINHTTSLMNISEEAKKRLWINPIEAIQRLKRLRKHIEKLIITITQIQKTKLSRRYQIETSKKPYLPRTSMELPEKFIEEALIQNLEIIEEGLRFVRRQIIIPDIGRIDILAHDKHGIPVVIEVKSGIADDTSLTQLLAYMSKIEEKEGKRPRGVIVAEEFTKKLQQAAKLLNNIKLIKIETKIVLKKIEEKQK